MPTDNLDRFSDPALLILISLAGGDKHGYAMMEDIEQISGTRLGPGTLYGALSRLEDRGLIQPIESNDRRRPYRITPKGLSQLHHSLTTIQGVTSVGFLRLGNV